MKIEFIDITSYRGISSNAEHFYASRIVPDKNTYESFYTDHKPYGNKEELLFFPDTQQAAALAAKDNYMLAVKGTVTNAQIEKLKKEGTIRFPSILEIIKQARKRFPDSYLSFTLYGSKKAFCSYIESLQEKSPETVKEIDSLLKNVANSFDQESSAAPKR